MYSTYEVVAYTVCLRMQKYWLPVLCFHLEGQMLFFFVLSVMCDGCSYFKLYQSSCLTNSVEKKTICTAWISRKWTHLSSLLSVEQTGLTCEIPSKVHGLVSGLSVNCFRWHHSYKSVWPMSVHTFVPFILQKLHPAFISCTPWLLHFTLQRSEWVRHRDSGDPLHGL